MITSGDLKYRSFLFTEHSMNHLFLKSSRCWIIKKKKKKQKSNKVSQNELYVLENVL